MAATRLSLAEDPTYCTHFVPMPHALRAGSGAGLRPVAVNANNAKRIASSPLRNHPPESRNSKEDGMTGRWYCLSGGGVGLIGVDGPERTSGDESGPCQGPLRGAPHDAGRSHPARQSRRDRPRCPTYLDAVWRPDAPRAVVEGVPGPPFDPLLVSLVGLIGLYCVGKQARRILVLD